MRPPLLGVLVCAAALGCMPAAASARDDVVSSFDGTPISVHFFAPATPPPDGRAPTVIVGATYPSPGETRADQDVGDRIGLATLRNAGYNVVTFDPRGLGASGGEIMFDSPAFEGRDLRRIVDYVAAQPDALLDAPGDPRVGMSGTSYGATIQLIAAALDTRIDAIVPDLGWHSLVTSLNRGGAVKTGWLAALCGLDVIPGAVDGVATIANVQPVTASNELKRACVEGVAGRLSPESLKWLADHGPGALVKQIRAPTLITQGTSDTLFPLDEAIESFAQLSGNGVPLKMIWYCGGHVPCPTEPGDQRYLARAGLAWLDRWLRQDASVDTGPAFEWFADDARWRSGPDFPLAPAGSIDAIGSGSLSISASDSPQRGLGRVASPTRDSVEASFPAPRRAGDVVGSPRVQLIYRGLAKPAGTHLYAQIVDTEADEVVGGQATPLPVILDGRVRRVERPLQAIAARASGASLYRLQIIGGTAAYQVQGSKGQVSIYGAFGSLPLVDAARSGRGILARTPKRARIVVTSRRDRRDGRFTRVRVRVRQPSGPCSGSVTFTVETDRRPYLSIAPLETDPCRAVTLRRLRLPKGAEVHVTATFNGNAKLKPRSAERVPYRVE